MAFAGSMQMTDPAGLMIVTFAQRPDLQRMVFGGELQSAVPEFMRHDPASALYYDDGQLDHIANSAWSRSIRPSRIGRSLAPPACRLRFVTAPADAKNCQTTAGTR